MKSRTIALLFAAGVFLGQLAWISAVPPYRGIDEFDHVYRAASVAEGYFGPGVGTPEAGRGDLVPVPPRLVTEGTEVCRSYKYTGRDNCRPVAQWDDDLITVASAASRYNPAFYWLIGKPGQLAQGAHAVYVMRLTAALVCAALVGLAAWVTATWSRTRWPLTALALSLTPVVVYSTALPAPNGIEMAGALCLWCSLLGLGETSDRALTKVLITTAGLGAMPLITVRTLGPLWFVLSLAAIIGTLGRKPFLDAVRRVPIGAACALILVVSLTALSGWWSVVSQTNALGEADSQPINPWMTALQKVPLWFLQSIAAFPTRSEPAPPVVYACAIIAFLTFVTWAVVKAFVRVRAGLLITGALSLAIPYAITVATVQTAGTVWQGRYTLPFSFGVVLIAGLALERARATSRLAPSIAAIFAITTAIAHTVSVVSVQRMESLLSPLAGDQRWIRGPLWMVASWAVLSVAFWAIAIVRAQHEDHADQMNPALEIETAHPPRDTEAASGSGRDAHGAPSDNPGSLGPQHSRANQDAIGPTRTGVEPGAVNPG